jgi:exodeoxyribonuclease VII large subunit
MKETPYLSLSDLSKQINRALSQAFSDRNFWVVADVTNHTYKQSGKAHYFELVEKDPGSSNIMARLSCKAWGKGSDTIAHFERITGQPFTSNIHVLVNVSVQFHPVFGLQLNLNGIDPHFTMGMLEKQKQETLQLLVSENPAFIVKDGTDYVTRNKQLVLPHVIEKIALVSAQSSAGAEDFRHTLWHNTFGYTFTIDDYFTPVQGAGNAEVLLAKIIEVFQSGKVYDAVVLTRGGGAQTDFLIFDHYKVGQAIAKFPVPVITGIGHQKNETIADLMAHTQTKTPTKAAEFILAHNKEFEDIITALQKNILLQSQQLLSKHNHQLNGLNTFVVHITREILTAEKDKVTVYKEAIIRAADSMVHSHKNALTRMASTMFSRPLILLEKRKNDIGKCIATIKSSEDAYLRAQQSNLDHYRSLTKIMSPEHILKKGFAILKVNDKIITHSDQISLGTELEIIFDHTEIKSTVQKKTTYDGKEFNL